MTGAWFINKPKVAKEITVTVFKVLGETNTDDLSPAPHATTRPDIPLHAMVMLESKMPEGIALIAQLKEKGHPVAYVAGSGLVTFASKMFLSYLN